LAKKSTRSLSPLSESAVSSEAPSLRTPSIRDATKMVDEVVRSTTGSVMKAAAVAGGLTAAAVSTDLTSELNNIDFRKMIGGPLQAAVDAQVASSLATVDFINKVGFTEPDSEGKRELVMVDFTHKRTDVNAEGVAVPTEVFIKVPLLAMLPIPSLRIEHVIIDFNVKLNSVESSKTSDALGIAVEVGGGFGPVNFKVSASYQRKTATSVEVKKEYALNVNVKAVQDEIPAGLEKIFNMMAA
jgi:Protein of unknown function (DUF2589)